MTNVTATLTDKGLSLIVDGEPSVVGKTHVNFNKILDCLRTKDYDAIPDLLNVAATVVKQARGLVTIIGGVVHHKGIAMHNSLTTRMLQMISLGIDVEPMAKFLENLMENPSFRSVEQLYNFMEACDLPITKDGCLLAYRSVNNDYWDTHTGKTSLSVPPEKIGTTSLPSDAKSSGVERYFTRNGVTTTFTDEGTCVVSMERNMVDDNPDQTCSKGLHICSQKYGMYGSRLLLVKINPRDVVSVPRDYNQAKMRVCRYEVVKDAQAEGFKTFTDTPVFFEEEDECSWEHEAEDSWDENDPWKF